MTVRLVKTCFTKKCKKCTKKRLLTERLVKNKKRIYNFQLFNKKKYYLITTRRVVLQSHTICAMHFITFPAE